MARPSRDRDPLRLPPRHGRETVMVTPAELDPGVRALLPASIVFALDASGGEGGERAAAVRGAVASLLGEPDLELRAAVVLLAAGAGEPVVPPTGSAERARRQLANLPVGGPAALAPGLRGALRAAAEEATRFDGHVPLLVLVSDGAALKPTPDALVPAARTAALGIPALVVDTSARGSAALERLAGVMHARLLNAPGASAELVAAVVSTEAALAAREPRWRPPPRARRGR